MQLRDKNILIISPEDWGDCWLSKHHYAQILADRGNRVFFLGPCLWREKPTPSDGVTLLSEPKSPRGLRFLPRLVRDAAHRKIRQELEKEAGTSFDLVWSFDPSRFMSVNRLTSGLSIFFLADKTEQLPWKLAAASADLCLGCSTEILQLLKSVNPNTMFVNHGYLKRETFPYDFETPAPRAVYAGNLAYPTLDRHRILRLVKEYPDVHFHFFGDTGTGNLSRGEECELVKKLREYPNAHIKGSVSPHVLASVYESADVLLLFYDPFTEYVVENSHKMMEYLGSGTPILTTRIREYDKISTLLEVHDDPDPYCQALGKILQNNDQSLARQRIEFAEQNTYHAHLKRIETALTETLHSRVQK